MNKVTDSYVLELIINGLGSLYLNNSNISADYIDAVLIDNSKVYIEEDNRQTVYLSIPSTNLLRYAISIGKDRVITDTYHPADGHRQSEYTLEAEDITITHTLVSEYIKQGGTFKIDK